MKKKSKWVTFLKVIAWLCIAAGCVISVIVGLSAISAQDHIVIGLIAAAAGIIFSFTFAAIIMVFLEIAEDVREIRNSKKQEK